ncbi:AbrB/MazE/SpoVT family DNA-binding domain-containing protein [Pseudomonas mohnii]
MRKPPMKIIIEEWDGDGAIRIPDEALQELELDVGDAVYLIEEFVGNSPQPPRDRRCKFEPAGGALTKIENSGGRANCDTLSTARIVHRRLPARYPSF